MLEALNISSATAWVAPELLIALQILSGLTAKRSAVDWEHLKPNSKSEKGHISVSDQKSYYLQVSQRFYQPHK